MTNIFLKSKFSVPVKLLQIDVQRPLVAAMWSWCCRPLPFPLTNLDFPDHQSDLNPDFDLNRNFLVRGRPGYRPGWRLWWKLLSVWTWNWKERILYQKFQTINITLFKKQWWILNSTSKNGYQKSRPKLLIFVPSTSFEPASMNSKVKYDCTKNLFVYSLTLGDSL